MPFKQFVRAEIAAGLDETYQFEDWAAEQPGRAYYDVHVSVIEARERCVPTLRRVLAGSGLRILESGCGTGRWMAFFERLGHRAFGVDDSLGPLRVARAHDPALRLVRGDALASPFKSHRFDAVFSSYVAEHFEDGPEALLRELHRVLVPGGLLLLIVPYNSLFRRVFTHRALQAFYAWARWRDRPLAFTEYRYSRREIDGFLARTGFAVEHVEPDDFRPPWSKGICLDLGPLVLPRGAAPGSWQPNRFGRWLARACNALSPWTAAAGIFYVARATGGPQDGRGRIGSPPPQSSPVEGEEAGGGNPPPSRGRKPEAEILPRRGGGSRKRKSSPEGRGALKPSPLAGEGLDGGY